MKKRVLKFCGVLILFLLINNMGKTTVHAEEMSIGDRIRYNEQNKISPDFDLSKRLKETEEKLLLASKEKLNKDYLDFTSVEYLNFLDKVANTNEFHLGDSESENIEFTEFSAIYISNIFVESSDVDRENLLNRTYQEIKEENIKNFLQAEELAKSVGERSAYFNYSKGTSYAKQYSLRYNNYYQTFPSDCTNFTSQIAFAGGKQKVWTKNASGYAWYWDKKNVYSHAWTVANIFTQYWTADGALTITETSKAGAQRAMKEGAFVAYWNKNTYQISHMSYCNYKKNGKANISQHTTDRWNYPWDSVNTSTYSSFIILYI